MEATIIYTVNEMKSFLVIKHIDNNNVITQFNIRKLE